MDAPPSRLRVAFMGTPDLARTVLRRLADDPRWDVVLVVAQPDKPVGRGLQLQAPPVKEEALARGIPVRQPLKARDPEFVAHLHTLALDLIIVAAYGQILPPDLLAIPRRGCLNVHTSLLPRWRGAAPIQWALLEGDAESGVTIMRMDAGLDTGDIVALERTPLTAFDTGQTLHDRLAELGGELLVRVLPDWLAARIDPVPQPAEGVTYARKLKKEDGRLDWTLPATVLDRRIRALDPWPGAYTELVGGGERPVLVKIWQAEVGEGASATALPGEIIASAGDELRVATGSGVLRIRALQREGRRRMTTREFLAGDGLHGARQFGGGSGSAPGPRPAN